jgi:hypothetical protein
VERESSLIIQKVRRLGVERTHSIHEFGVRWLAEEHEHARFLQDVADVSGVEMVFAETYRRPTRDVRAFLSPLGQLGGRLLGLDMTAIYGVHGAMQEFVAATTYRHLARLGGCSEVAKSFRRLAAQEGRHMKFYRSVAEDLLHERRRSRLACARLMRHWRPPGVDLYGLPSWSRIAAPLLSDSEFMTDQLRLDDFVSALPGLTGVRPMHNYLSGNGLL